MIAFLRRAAASLTLRAETFRRVAFLLTVLSLAVSARAVVVRGRVTDALGTPVANGEVKLTQGGQVVAFAYSGADGSYEVRYSGGGRFTLLGIAPTYLPAVGVDFYGGETDVLQQDVVLSAATVRQEVSVSATGIPTPLPQLTAPVSVVPGELLATEMGVVDPIRQTPGAFLAQSGQYGGVTSLFLRGGNSTANLVLVDGIPAGDVGGTFDFGTVSSTAVDSIEVYRGPDSAIYGTDAGAGVIAVSTARGSGLGAVNETPVLTYTGDAGNLHTWRDEVAAGGAYRKVDYYGAFSRFDSSNALPMDRFHSATSAANVGYDVNGNTQVRLTLRNADSATGLPGAEDFDGLAQNAKEKDQDLYSGVTAENRYKQNWHNLVRYGIARKREQAVEIGNVGTLVTFYPGTAYAYTGYVGNKVSIRGANGYTATGRVQLFSGNSDDQDSNRDQLYYQSDYSVNRHLLGLFGFRYDRERGSFNDYDPAFAYVSHEKIQRTNFEYNLLFQGEFFDRLFYSAGGSLEKNHLYGIAGTPRLGLSYVPVRTSSKAFHGTRLRANAATGVQEPTLALEYSSLYKQATTAQIAQFHLTPPAAERSRTYDLGVDQNVLGEKLTLKAGYFHNVFDHQLEGVSAQSLAQYFGIGTAPPCGPYSSPVNGLCPLPQVYTAYINSLAYRAQGAELELAWHPKPALLVRGGYTFLDARVVQSFSSDAVAANQGVPTTNPNLPNVAIGATSPLVGARPFRRAPHTGFVEMQYAHKKLNLMLRSAMASRSDDSTFLGGEDYIDGFNNSGNTLLLPNRDLDFGYVKLDLGLTYALKHGFTYFGQVDNLLNDQHIGPIGYPGLPLAFRTGLKLRLGGGR